MFQIPICSYMQKTRWIIVEKCLRELLGHRIADDFIPKYLNSIPDPAGLKTKCGPTERVVCSATSAQRVRQFKRSHRINYTVTLNVLMNVGIAGQRAQTNPLYSKSHLQHLDPQIARHKRALDFDHKLHPNFIVVCILQQCSIKLYTMLVFCENLSFQVCTLDC